MKPLQRLLQNTTSTLTLIIAQDWCLTIKYVWTCKKRRIFEEKPSGENSPHTHRVLPSDTPEGRVYTTLLTTLLRTTLWVVALSVTLLSEPTELLSSASWFQEHRDCSAELSSSLAATTLCRQGSRTASVSDPSLERPVISSSTALAEEEISSLLWVRLDAFPAKKKKKRWKIQLLLNISDVWHHFSKRSTLAQHESKIMYDKPFS